MSPTTTLAPFLLLAVLALAGRALAADPHTSAPLRWVYATLAGWWLLHLVLTLLDLVGVPWSVPVVVAPLLLVAVWRLRERTAAPPSPRIGWGDVVALLAVVAFAALSATRWIAFSDFVYHWGLKGHRFLLARHVDYDYLAQPWNWVIHPDYPNLFPELLAVTGLLGDSWHEGALALWSPLMLALTLVAARESLSPAATAATNGTEVGAGDPWMRQALLALLACSLAAFGIGHRMAGSADWLIALALVAALPPLVRPADRGGDLQLGLCAAVAAAAKMEGVPLAAWLVGVQLVRHLRVGRRRALASLPRLVLPVAAVVLPWGLRVLHHSLYQQFNSGPLVPHRALLAAPALVQSMAVSSWQGMTLGLLLLPPLLLARGPLRPFAIVLALQAMLYGWQYLTAPVDTHFLVLSTFPRLALHLLPSVLVAAALVWLGDRRATGAPPSGAR
jgi:hypothetical protein